MRVFTSLSSLLLTTLLCFQAPLTAQNPVELGKVNWGRDLDAAKKKSAATGKPLFVQFQEVPG